MKPRNYHIVLSSMILISLFVWGQMAIYLLHELFGFDPKWAILQYCVAALQEQSVLHQIVLVLLNVMIAYSFGMILWLIGKQAIHERRWNVRLQMIRHNRLSKQFNHKFKKWGHEIIVIRHDSIIALAFGSLRPRIVISTALLNEFTEREIDAILLHESGHCQNYDPLRMLMVRIMKDSLPFIPILKRLSHYIDVWVELEADHYAVMHMKSPIDLASVLLKCSRLSQRTAIGIGFADKAINYRLQRLIEPKKKIRVPLLDFIPVTISSFMIVILSSIVISGCT
ncbi:M56 family metallopeptidase [Paenibacillus spongiae]|uniref:M56 family metallopeptidase n=1 Tax=Paenibacillus spongiae TaxID=2909671 RepID=A0ABY5SHG1_9BACL|nr:M56 family metallopeptidase [Paenibacillus spongiae]UVI33441.1 M56 family metallopeptidase [Paenibacillus spongiae]